MVNNKRRDMTLIARIVDRQTGRLKGWLHRWNTDEEMPLWVDGPSEDVRYSTNLDYELRFEFNATLIGQVRSDNVALLRVLGRAYAIMPDAVASVSLHDPDGAFVADFDYWTGSWDDP